MWLNFNSMYCVMCTAYLPCSLFILYRKFINIEQNIRRGTRKCLHAVPLVYIMFLFLEQYVWNEVITTIAQVFIGKKVSVVQAAICCALLTHIWFT